MDNKKLAELMQDKAFMEKVLEATTEEEVKKLFSDRGIELTSDDINFLAKAIAKASTNEGKLSEKDLESIAGGKIENYSDFGTGVSVGAAIVAVPAVIGAAYAFKKGVDYAKSWWNYSKTKYIEKD